MRFVIYAFMLNFLSCGFALAENEEITRMSNYKLITKESELSELQIVLNKLVEKGPSNSKWAQFTGDVFSDISQPEGVSFDIEKVFHTIASLEISDRQFHAEEFSNYPQWMYWLKDDLMGGRSGYRFTDMYSGLYSWFRGGVSDMSDAEKNKLIGTLIDSSALLPTNLTATRLSYYVQPGTGVPLKAKLRFTIGYLIGLQKGLPESVCAQYGVIAALPAPIRNKAEHKEWWSGGMPNKSDYSDENRGYVPLQFVLNEGGLNFGLLESNGLFAI